MIKVSIDAEVKVLYRENEKDIIGQDIIFSKVYNEQRKLHGNTRQAVTETIRVCKDRNVLKEYLETREQEVVDIMMTLFDDEQILKAYVKDIEDNTARKTAEETARKTAKETARKTATETAERMIKKGKMPLEEIADYVPSLSFDELKELKAKIMQ